MQATSLVRDVMCVLAQTDPRVRAPAECPGALLQALGGALLHAEASVVIIEGKPDIFAFGARRIALGVANDWIVKNGKSVDASERAVALQLVAAEAQKLTREQALPMSAAGLLHAFAILYPLSMDSASVLARRLGEIEDSLEGAALDALDAWALEDPLAAYETYPALIESVTSLRLALRAFDLVPPHGARIERLHGQEFSAEEAQKLQTLRTSFQRRTSSEPKSTTAKPALVTMLSGTATEVTQRVSLLVKANQCTTDAAALCHDVLTLGLWADALARDRAAVRQMASKFALWSNDLEPTEKERLLRWTAADPLPFLEIARVFLVP